MFYVHLFLKAMYRKTTGKTKQKLTLYFQNVLHMQVHAEQLKVLKLQKAVASNVEEAE